MKIKELLPLVKVHGRTIYDEEKEALFCNWTCSGLTIRFKGKKLRVKALALSDQIPGMPNMPTPPADWPCIGAAVEDKLIYRHECREAEQWLTLYEDDEEKKVTLRIVKVSENARGKLGIVEVETDGVMIIGFYKIDGKYNRGKPALAGGDYITKINDFGLVIVSIVKVNS